MKVVVSFTGGKDSCLAVSLLQLLKDERLRTQLPPSFTPCLPNDVRMWEIMSLVAFAPKGAGVTSFKAHPFSLIEKQAEALRLPLSVIEIEGPDYHGAYRDSLRRLCVHDGDVWGFVTGDILDVCSGFLEKAAAAAGVPLIRPLWGIKAQDLLQSVWALGIKPLITCVHKSKFTQPEPKGCPLANGQSALHTAAGGDRSDCPGNNGNGGTATQDVHAEGGRGVPAGEGHCVSGVQQEWSGQHMQVTPQAAKVLQDPVGTLLGATLSPGLHATLQPALAALGIHPCGEMGEFHSMCLDGPTFACQLQVQYEVRQDADYAWCTPTSISSVPKEAAPC